MNTVWVLQEIYRYEGGTILSVHETLVSGIMFAEKHMRQEFPDDAATTYFKKVKSDENYHCWDQYDIFQKGQEPYSSQYLCLKRYELL